MTEANQQQGTTQEAAHGRSDEPTKGKLFDFAERVRSGELKARMHYFLFRKGQEVKKSDSLFSRYKKRLQEDWDKWLGIGAGITGLIMLFSPGEFWLWQMPLVFILMAIAPAFFELPNTLNALFGHTEQQHLVGDVITLTQAIVDGKGRTTLEDREWLVSGPDCLAGTSVQIVTLDSRTLYVVQTEQENLNNGGYQDGR
ncbi:MAG: NfeD family protein [Thiolinea sp.]